MSPLLFRWLGVAGVELEFNQSTLLIDPYLTRMPLHKIFNRVEPDQAEIDQHIHGAEAILVTHSHWDHLFDVAAIAQKYGAAVYGSTNTCQILRAQGLPSEKVHLIRFGDKIQLPFFEVTVKPGEHVRTPLDHWLNAPLSLPVQTPILPIDYHKDEVFTFQIAAGGFTFFHGKADQPADVLLINPYQTSLFFETELKMINPRLVIPIHWENFMLPASKKLQPMFEPINRQFPWIKKVDLTALKNKVETACPTARIFFPEMFTTCSIDDIIQKS